MTGNSGLGFPITAEVDSDVFPRRAEEARQQLNGNPSFGLSLSDGNAARLTFYTIQGKFSGAKLSVPAESIDHLVSEHLAPGVDFASAGDENNQEYIYPGERIADIGTFTQLRERFASQKALAGLVVPKEVRLAQVIEPHDAADIIAGTDPRQIVFYTGAGISNAGEYPVLDHGGLGDLLGFCDGSLRSSGGVQNDLFVQRFLTDQQKGIEIMQGYDDFLHNMYVDESTLAHCAIARIVRALDLQPIILTSNHDLKHEAEGSRVTATKVRHAWHISDSLGLPDQEEAVRASVRHVIEARALQTRLLIVAGNAHDYRGVYAYMREVNPSLTILAINKHAQPTELPYVGAQDYLIPGDAQNTLPEIATRLEASTL